MSRPLRKGLQHLVCCPLVLCLLFLSFLIDLDLVAAVTTVDHASCFAFLRLYIQITSNVVSLSRSSWSSMLNHFTIILEFLLFRLLCTCIRILIQNELG